MGSPRAAARRRGAQQSSAAGGRRSRGGARGAPAPSSTPQALPSMAYHRAPARSGPPNRKGRATAAREARTSRTTRAR
eukprot:scaffold18702_cov54-Phaeocystis_antarctica.AAC.7